MTEQLKQAAQAALNACERIVDQEDSPVQFGIDFRALGSSLRRALTTSQPAAQATPVQDVGASADYWGDLAQQKADADARRGVSMPVSYYTSSIVGALLATQQATPEPADDAQVRAIGEGLRSAHDHIEMHKLERSHCKDAERIREGLAAFSAYRKRQDFAATPPQQAAGEPEGFALVPVKATPKVAMVIYEGARNCFSPKVAEGLWQDALAAAQAKGGQT